MLRNGISTVEVNGADEGFEGIAVHAAVGSRTGILLKHLINSDFNGQVLQVLAANDSATHLREKTLILEWVLLKEQISYHSPKNCITQIFEALVAEPVSSGGFERQGAMAEGQFIKRDVAWIKTEQALQSADERLVFRIRQKPEPDEGAYRQIRSGIS
jgi:hypothetical protein